MPSNQDRSFKDQSALQQEALISKVSKMPDYQRFLENCLTMGLVAAMNTLLTDELKREQKDQSEKHDEPYPPFNADKGS
jgi:hypothetical protein